LNDNKCKKNIIFLKAKNPKYQKDEWDLTLQVRGGSPSQVF